MPCFADSAAPVENGDTEMSTEEPWDQKDAEPNEEEPGGGDRGPAVQADAEEAPSETMEEEEEAPAPKVPPPQPDAPRKEHINVVFIGHVGRWIVFVFRSPSNIGRKKMDRCIFQKETYVSLVSQLHNHKSVHKKCQLKNSDENEELR